MENITQETKKKKFLIMILVIVVLFIGVVFLFTQNWGNRNTSGLRVVPGAKKTYTQEEKKQILADLSRMAPKDNLSQTVKVKTLSTLSKNAPVAPTLTQEEKAALLKTLVASSGQ